MKKLRKIKPAIDRQHRQSCQPDENDLQYPQVQADGPDTADDRTINADDTASEDRQPENRMGKRDQKEADGADASDDVLRPYSDQAGPGRDYSEAGERRVGGPLKKEDRRLLDVAAARGLRDRRRSDPTGDRGDPLEPLSAKWSLLMDQGDQEAQGDQVRADDRLTFTDNGPHPIDAVCMVYRVGSGCARSTQAKMTSNLAGDHRIG
jgi:hypothetical protein